MEDKIIAKEKIVSADIFNLVEDEKYSTLNKLYKNNKKKLHTLHELKEREAKAVKPITVKFINRSDRTPFIEKDNYFVPQFKLSFDVQLSTSAKTISEEDSSGKSTVEPSSINSFIKNYRFIENSDFETHVSYHETTIILASLYTSLNNLTTIMNQQIDAEYLKTKYLLDSQNIWDFLAPYINKKIFQVLYNGNQSALINTVIFKDYSYLRVKTILDEIFKNDKGFDLIKYSEKYNTKLHRELIFIELLTKIIFFDYNELNQEAPKNIFKSFYFYIPSLFITPNLISRVLTEYNLIFGDHEQFRRNHLITTENGFKRKIPSFSFRRLVSISDYAKDPYLGDLLNYFHELGTFDLQKRNKEI